MSDDVFQRYGAYYDLLYRDKDYAAETAYVAQLLRSNAPAVKTLLEFGSGTGRHGRLLAREGFDILGIERSDTMVRLAQQADDLGLDSADGRFASQVGDIRTVHAGRAFDAVISLFHVISYLTGNGDLLQTFANAARHLHPGGLFVFDVWHGPAVLHERPAVRLKRAEDAQTRLTRIAEPEINVTTGVVTVRYTMFAEPKTGVAHVTFGEEHHMRYLFPTEIDLLARASGFEVVASEEFLTGKPATESTWGVAYVLRKRA